MQYNRMISILKVARMNLKKSVVLITGAGSGIGESLAEHFGQKGSRLFLADRDSEAVQRTAEGLKSKEITDFETFCGDVADERDSQEMVDSALRKFEKINVVIPCAGLIRDGLTISIDKETRKVKKKLSLKDWSSVVNVNLTGSFLTIRDCAEAMANGGWPSLIVPIASVNKAGQIGQINYSSSKVAISLFPKILVGEFLLKKINNIRVVGIAPGYTKTPMLEKMNQSILEKLIKDVHLQRLIEPKEIAILIEHIVENEAINGTTIEITGGLCHQSSVVK